MCCQDRHHIFGRAAECKFNRNTELENIDIGLVGAPSVSKGKNCFSWYFSQWKTKSFFDGCFSDGWSYFRWKRRSTNIHTDRQTDLSSGSSHFLWREGEIENCRTDRQTHGRTDATEERETRRFFLPSLEHTQKLVLQIAAAAAAAAS